jgi:dUTP pyrophosphatase
LIYFLVKHVKLCREGNWVRIEYFTSNPRINNPPKPATDFSGWFDIMSNQHIFIKPGETALINTGLYINILDKKYYRIKLHERSGLAAKYDIHLHAGCIDSDYNKEIKVVLRNDGKESYTINIGDRICQASVEEIISAKFNQITDYYTVESDKDKNDIVIPRFKGITNRGGFGSTGK